MSRSPYETIAITNDRRTLLSLLIQEKLKRLAVIRLTKEK